MDKKLKAGIAVAAVGSAVAANLIKAKKFVPEERVNEPYPAERVDLERYSKNLSDAIKIKTISNVDESKVDWAAFDELHALFEERYPLVHKTLKKEVVGKASLLYTWEGKNPDLEPIALLGHQDVVPISAGTEQDWEHDPFGGDIADGYVWGRGAVEE